MSSKEISSCSVLYCLHFKPKIEVIAYVKTKLEVVFFAISKGTKTPGATGD